jgi:2-C-methyl-D-erythritol 4-phosphate cytidylyltransferase
MDSGMTFAVILPAAGSGTRFGKTGGSGDKLLIDIEGRSVLQRSVGAFSRRQDVETIMIVTAKDRFDDYRKHLRETVEADRLLFVEGGRERWESVVFGLRALSARERVAHFVAVHDAARPLVREEVIEEAFRAAQKMGGAFPCVPEPATLKRRGADGRVAETVDRKGLYQAQTPQCFELAKLLAGYEKLIVSGQVGDLTDDAQVFERMGLPVMITQGSPTNIKITTGGDVAFARAVVAANGGK